MAILTTTHGKHASLTSRFAVEPDAAARAILAPFTREVIYDLPLSTPADVQSAVARARQVQRDWAVTSVRERTRIIRRFHDVVLSRRQEILDIVQWETGKARADALEELLDVCMNARYYARIAHGQLRSQRHMGALPGLVGVRELRKPVGVVGVIAPWNYPLTLAASDALPALLAGNAVVLKPDPQTSLTAAWVADQFLRAGLPDGLLSVVTGDGPTIGGALIDAADHVMFTFDGDPSGAVAWAPLPEMEDGAWHTMNVTVADPHVTVEIDGVAYIDTDISGYFGFPAYVGFTAATGSLTNYHLIDALEVTQYVCE